MGARGAQSADVADSRFERDLKRRVVQLLVVGEEDAERVGVQRGSGQVLGRPLDDQFVGVGKALGGGEGGARVDDHGAESELAGEVDQVDRDVDRPDDEQLGQRLEVLDEHFRAFDLAEARCREILTRCQSRGGPVEVRRAERSLRAAVVPHEEARAECVAVGSGERDQPLAGQQGPAQGLESGTHRRQPGGLRRRGARPGLRLRRRR